MARTFWTRRHVVGVPDNESYSLRDVTFIAHRKKLREKRGNRTRNSGRLEARTSFYQLIVRFCGPWPDDGDLCED